MKAADLSLDSFSSFRIIIFYTMYILLFFFFFFYSCLTDAYDDFAPLSVELMAELLNVDMVSDSLYIIFDSCHLLNSMVFLGIP